MKERKKEKKASCSDVSFPLSLTPCTAAPNQESIITEEPVTTTEESAPTAVDAVVSSEESVAAAASIEETEEAEKKEDEEKEEEEEAKEDEAKEDEKKEKEEEEEKKEEETTTEQSVVTAATATTGSSAATAAKSESPKGKEEATDEEADGEDSEEQMQVSDEVRALTADLSLNHILIGFNGVREQAVEAAQEAGFTVDVQGTHRMTGSYNATIEFAGGYYLELIGMQPTAWGGYVQFCGEHLPGACHFFARTPLTPALESRLLKESATLARGGLTDFVLGYPPGHRFTVRQLQEAGHYPLRLTPDYSQDNKRWLADDLAPQCFTCDAAFSLFLRRHHCRMCGLIFCEDCLAPVQLPARLAGVARLGARPHLTCQPCREALARCEKPEDAFELAADQHPADGTLLMPHPRRDPRFDALPASQLPSTGQVMFFDLVFPDEVDLPFLCQDQQPRALWTTTTTHANGAYAVRRLVTLVTDLAASRRRYCRLLLRQPLPVEDTLPLPADLAAVPVAERCDFDVAGTHITLVSAQTSVAPLRPLFAEHMFDSKREGRPYLVELLTSRADAAGELSGFAESIGARLILVHRPQEATGSEQPSVTRLAKHSSSSASLEDVELRVDLDHTHKEPEALME